MRWLAETNEQEEAADWTTKATGHLIDGWPSRAKRAAAAAAGATTRDHYTWIEPARHPLLLLLVLLHRCPQVGQQKSRGETLCVSGPLVSVVYHSGTLPEVTQTCRTF